MAEHSAYLNEVYKNLNEPDIFHELDGQTLADAHLMACELTARTTDSHKRLHQLQKFILTCKLMFLSESQSKVYALLYRNKMQRVKSQLADASL